VTDRDEARVAAGTFDGHGEFVRLERDSPAATRAGDRDRAGRPPRRWLAGSCGGRGRAIAARQERPEYGLVTAWWGCHARQGDHQPLAAAGAGNLHARAAVLDLQVFAASGAGEVDQGGLLQWPGRPPGACWSRPRRRAGAAGLAGPPDEGIILRAARQDNRNSEPDLSLISPSGAPGRRPAAPPTPGPLPDRRRPLDRAGRSGVR
jgi:hypothetical protein